MDYPIKKFASPEGHKMFIDIMKELDEWSLKFLFFERVVMAENYNLEFQKLKIKYPEKVGSIKNYYSKFKTMIDYRPFDFKRKVFGRNEPYYNDEMEYGTELPQFKWEDLSRAEQILATE